MSRAKKPPRVRPPEVVWVLTTDRGQPWSVETSEAEALGSWLRSEADTIHRYRLDEPKKKGAKR